MDHDRDHVRVLDESEWSLYRDVRLGGLEESPGSFTATLAEEADRDEQFWRDRMTRSHRLLAELGPVPQGIVSLGPYGRTPQRRRSSVCTSSQRHGVPVSPGDSSRLRRHWRPSRLTCSSSTGWGPTTGVRSASRRTSGSAPPTTAAQHGAPTRTGRGDRHGAVAGARCHISAEPDPPQASHPRRPSRLRPGQTTAGFGPRTSRTMSWIVEALRSGSTLGVGQHLRARETT